MFARGLLFLCATVLLAGVGHGQVVESLDEYVNAIKQIEATYPNEGRASIITRIRKAYYDAGETGTGGKKGIAKLLGVSAWDVLIPDRKKHPGLGSVPAQAAALVTAKRPLAKFNGETIDLGHVFTGLDSSNFPRCSWLAKSVFGLGTDCRGPCTWSGDVGSVLTCISEHRHSNKNNAGNMWEVYNKCYKSRNSREDQLGNLDGIVLGHLGRTVKTYQNKPLSEMLSVYYKLRARSWRTTLFLRVMGWSHFGSKSGYRMTPYTRNLAKGPIVAFGKAYFKKARKQYFFFRSPLTTGDIDATMDMFMNELQRDLKAEASRRRAGR